MENKERLLFLEDYLPHVKTNELEILSSEQVGCLHCGQVYPARLVADWESDNGGMTAICPSCGFRYVVGDASGLEISPKRFRAFSQVYLDLFGVEKEREEQRKFCELYETGIIADSPSNSLQFLSYLEELRTGEYAAYATLALARFYHYGSAHHPPENVEQAIALYKDPVLSSSCEALCELGDIYLARDARGDARKAYECFSKATALGYLPASIQIAYMYLMGKFVHRDPKFGFELLYSTFQEAYARFMDNDFPALQFTLCSFYLGLCCQEGYGTKANDLRARKFFLLGKAAYESSEGFEATEFAKVLAQIDDLLAQNESDTANSDGTMFFDEDTFVDSFIDTPYYESPKTLTHIEYRGDQLCFGIHSSRPMLLVDAASGQFQFSSESEWTFVNATFECTGEIKDFQRIEFLPADSIRFLRLDPLRGPIVVASIKLEPLDNEAEEEE